MPVTIHQQTIILVGLSIPGIQRQSLARGSRTNMTTRKSRLNNDLQAPYLKVQQLGEY